MTDRQLPLEPTERINPSTQVDRVPGHDAVCECTFAGVMRSDRACAWPFCAWKPHLPEQEDA